MLQGTFEFIGEDRQTLAPLFQGPKNGLIRSCLQGHMGQAFGDHPKKPSLALLCLGDFASFSGDSQSPWARHLAGKLTLQPGKTWFIAAQRGWEEPIRAWRPQSMIEGTRYSIREETHFNPEFLERLAKDVPDGISLHNMEEGLYQEAMAFPWSRDFCSVFQDEADYAKRGLGVGAIWEGELVSGASSYAVYDGGLEIEVDTRPDMRRKGLAAACCARLILRCIEGNIHPSWDAANTASVALAQKLGYEMDASYPIWEVRF